jgi:hypothetical protein
MLTAALPSHPSHHKSRALVAIYERMVAHDDIPYGIYDLLANRGSVAVGVPMTYPPSPLTPLLIGGEKRDRFAIVALDNFSSSAIPAAVTVIVAALGKPNSSPNWPIPRAHSHRRPLPHRCFQMEPYRPSSLFSDLQKTGRANRSTAITRSGTSLVPPELNPECRSVLISTGGTI